MTGRPLPGHTQLLEAISAVIEERGGGLYWWR